MTLRGHKRVPLAVSGMLARLRPRDTLLAEFHARILIAPPATAAQSQAAMDTLVAAAERVPSQRIGSGLADTILVWATEGADPEDIVAASRPFAEMEPHLALPGFRSLVNGLIDRGHPAARGVLEQLIDADHRTVVEFIHSSAIRMGDFELARRVFEAAQGHRFMTDSVAAMFEAEVDLASARSVSALDRLVAVPPERPAAFSQRLLRAAAAVGDFEHVLAYLDETVHNLGVVDEAQFRFEAHWALGDIDAAAASLTTARDEFPLHALLLRLERRALAATESDAAEIMIDRIRRLEATLEEPTMGDITSLMAAYFETECLDDVQRLAAATPDDLLGPASRIHLARTRYVLRDFDGAEAALAPLHGSWWRWDGDKLHARIKLERGDPETALAMRARRRPGGDLDEVAFHALLSLGRESEAFDRYLSDDDRRHLTSVFGDRAHAEGQLDPVSHRFVAMQAGPGDEIMLASLYAAAAEASDRLSVTCEPRLESLMRRSFPEIDFVPVRRLRPNEFGWRRDEPDRVEAGPLASLFDGAALAIARTADSVVLGRSLPSVTSSKGLPAAGYLTPRPEAVALAQERRGTGPLLGVVWRSEMRSAVRDIHYLKVADLAQLLPAGVDIACLQHDATDDEMDVLRSLAETVIDLEDLDLRNDFEAAAGVVAACDVVVGIGTTMVELAGAVGTPTVMMQPTHFGTWRARPGTDADYWHRSVAVARVDRPWDTAELVAKAREQIMLRLAAD